MFMIDITVDTEFQLAYVKLGSGQFGKTTCLNNSLNIDFDTSDHVIGVEFLSFNRLNNTLEGLFRECPDLSRDVIESVICAQEMLHSHFEK